MKNKYILLIIGLTILTGCSKLTCDFSYSPSSPRAGEAVIFSNQSSGGDDYEWSFGDNVQSTANSPTHIFKKPGTYVVRLTVIRNKVEKRVRTHEITVLDTVPAIAFNTDSVKAFAAVKLSVNTYNPWGKETTYRWQIDPSKAVLLAGKGLDSAAVICYFTCPDENITVKVAMQQGDKTMQLERTEKIYPHLAPSVLTATGETYWEQHYYPVWGRRVYQSPIPTTSEPNIGRIQAEQDTVYQYGDSRFTVAKVSAMTGQTVNGFQVDRLTNKIYAYGAALWVCNINGTYRRTLAEEPIRAIKVDGAGNRLYWATDAGLFAAPLLIMHNNTGDFSPELINDKTGITRLSVNTDIHE